jgi:hypothetical protein
MPRPPPLPQGASSRRHGPLIADAKALVGALRTAPAAVAPVVPLALGGRVSSTGSLKEEGAAPPAREVLSEEQVHLVLHVARQAQDTKTPKCGARAAAHILHTTWAPRARRRLTARACPVFFRARSAGWWRRRWTFCSAWWRTAC